MADAVGALIVRKSNGLVRVGDLGNAIEDIQRVGRFRATGIGRGMKISRAANVF
jgi:hypothetical protein